MAKKMTEKTVEEYLEIVTTTCDRGNKETDSNKAVEILEGIYRCWREGPLRLSQKGYSDMTLALYAARYCRSGFPIDYSGFEGRLSVRETVNKICHDHGSDREFTGECGGTTGPSSLRLRGLVKSYNWAMGDCEFNVEELDSISRNLETVILKDLDDEYWSVKPFSADVSRNDIPTHAVEKIIAASPNSGLTAQHLVGAKLQMRFPEIDIPYNSVNAGDLQTGRSGDFEINDCVYHVSMKPNKLHIEKAVKNKEHGLTPAIVCPRSEFDKTLSLIKARADDNSLEVIWLEQFVGTNMTELASGKSEETAVNLARLIREYNFRVSKSKEPSSNRLDEPAWVAELLDNDCKE